VSEGVPCPHFFSLVLTFCVLVFPTWYVLQPAKRKPRAKTVKERTSYCEPCKEFFKGGLAKVGEWRVIGGWVMSDGL
jgi:hypothetical protein